MKKKNIKSNNKQVFAVLIDIIMIILFVLSCRIIVCRIWNYFENTDELYNAAVAYPFEDEVKKNIDTSEEKKDTMVYFQNKIEKALTAEPAFWISDMSTWYYEFLKFCSMDIFSAQFASGKNASNTVISMGENIFTDVVKEDMVLVEHYTDEIIRFASTMQEQDRNFIYFSFPHKEMELSDPFYDRYYPNDIRKIETIVMGKLQTADLNRLSCMELLNAKGCKMEDMFFKTDHHWTPQNGIWACEELAKYLNETCGYSIDISLFVQEHYRVETMKDAWMGSQGRKVTPAYAELEDYYIVTPNYQTDYDVFISKENETLSGCMKETLYDGDSYEKYKTNPYDYYLYECYGYGDQALIQIHNNLVSDGSRILMIKASMADVMFPYFAAAVENLDVIDLRCFNGSLQTYIKETDPDTVIVMYSSACYIESYKALFDFR